MKRQILTAHESRHGSIWKTNITAVGRNLILVKRTHVESLN